MNFARGSYGIGIVFMALWLGLSPTATASASGPLSSRIG
jgi:hypothetical protein